ncbi:hypothetical protein TRFO_21454 [Tritrichomonas foetus]|uniref:Proteasome assembly chaperone 1 n=1 Tax=Tritrichomonas foetus TaxID=1144522 RepID=A0A1J4KDX9_9EUKA|nr:hypothetical protein TRFO_21454 [Tritrichomonas foetus]|eukprot:OHT09639.1 hypothetical protein TRFO_21454 [Tritrichomonas foetus]
MNLFGSYLNIIGRLISEIIEYKQDFLYKKMDEKVFSFINLSEGDHEYATFKYVGADISNKICFCAVSPSACSLFSAITEDLNPVGFFIITINDIINPIDFANGSEPCTKFIRSFRNEVFKIGDVTFILFERPNICTSESVNAVIEMVKPEEIHVFGSISKNEFIGETEAPKIYYLSTDQIEGDSKLAYPNTIKDVAAGLLIRGLVNRIKVKVLHLVESDHGANVDSMELWAAKIADYIQIDASAKAKHANHIAKIRYVNLNGIYS